ncbi:Uncharacterised protein [Vibrio cholerae]|nr:Uncharacterised protein [Vibrio cholerae]
MIGKSPRSTFSSSSHISRIIFSVTARTCSAVMKEVSISIWVNSG